MANGTERLMTITVNSNSAVPKAGINVPSRCRKNRTIINLIIRIAPIKIPQPARSEFLENRAQGDWAEVVLAHAIGNAGLAVTHYGASDDIQSDEAGFAEFFKAQIRDVRAFGKRPDLLIRTAATSWPVSVSHLPAAQRDPSSRRRRPALRFGQAATRL